MIYRRLGNSGIKVSVLSFGNWINCTDGFDEEFSKMVKVAFDNGINFFDTAECYERGQAERQMGKALKNLNVNRNDYVLSTKIYWGDFKDDKLPVNQLGTSRKHLIEGMKRALKNLEHDYVDIVFCHRYDIDTTTEEVVLGMKYILDQGMALYWATSEWPASRVVEAMFLCEKYGVPKPIAEQCQYSLLYRHKMEDSYLHLFNDYKYGTTVWSPLASGLLTNKHKAGMVKDSRLGDKNLADLIFKLLGPNTTVEELLQRVDNLSKIAERLGMSCTVLALAWVIKYKNVSTCLLGASRVSQLEENLKAVAAMDKLTPEVLSEIEDVIKTKLPAETDWKTFKPLPAPRDV